MDFYFTSQNVFKKILITNHIYMKKMNYFPSHNNSPLTAERFTLVGQGPGGPGFESPLKWESVLSYAGQNKLGPVTV